MILALLLNSVFYIACLGTAGAAAEDTNTPDDQIFELGKVIVSDSKNSSNLATTVTEVSMADITAKGAATAAEALEFLPGVFVQYGGKGEAHVSIRGFEQRQVKIMIDGVPARENYFGTVDLSMLPADTISKIVITKGASSVLYGANTMGGVINLITKKGGKTPQSTLSAAFGDYDTAWYSASHGGSVGNFNYWLAGGYKTSDGYRLSSDFDAADTVVGTGSQYNEDGGARDLSYYEKKNLDMKVGYDPGEDSSVYLSVNYVDNDRGIPTFFNRYWAYDHWKQWQINLAGEHRFSDTATAKAKVFYVSHEDGLTDVSWDADHTTSGKKWFEQSYYEDTSVGGELQGSFGLTSWDTLRLGVNFMEDNHKEANYLTSDCWDVIKGWASTGWSDEQEYTAQTYTVAVENEFYPTDRISIVMGVSWDFFKPVKTYNQPEPDKSDAFNPQIGVVFETTENTVIHGSVGRKTRFPSLKELYSDLSGGNPNLNPEKTLAYEVGVTQQFSRKISGQASFFYNDIEDLIDTITISGDKAYVNINEAVIYGVETGVNLAITPSMDVSLNYTWMSTEDKSNNGRDLEGRPRHRVNLGLGYRFFFGLTADLQASYNCGQHWENSSYEWVKLPSYFLINARLTQKLKKLGRVAPELFVQGTNLLDEDYYETGGPEPGFNFLAGITLRF